jgi:hypothetical protein
MKRMIKYPDIKDFNSAIRDITWASQYTGTLDDEGKPIMNRLAKCPTLQVHATEKIHGTNAAVCYSIPDGLWVQSRENIISLEKDNAGCASHAYSNETVWMTIIGMLAEEHKIDLEKYIISIYYEWSGGNIQKSSAVSGLDKRAILFKHFKVSPVEPQDDESTETAYWLPTSVTGSLSFDEADPISWIDYTNANVYNIMNFPNWEFNVDFENPKLSQNKFIELVEEHIELCSPLGKEMGIENNIGEGIVCEFWFKDTLNRFKVKGEKHTTSRVKTLAPVDEVKEQKKIEFANKVVTPGRCEQAWQKTFGIDYEISSPDVKLLGTFLKLVMNDVIKEETQVLFDLELEFKDTTKVLNKLAKNWFDEQLNEFYQK